MNTSIKTNIVILLTGTVNPGGMTMTELQDSNIRKSQYIDSIRYWANLRLPNVKIVFVENSNANLLPDILNIDNGNQIEYLTFNGNDYNKSLGKGYGELKCLQYAMTHSKCVGEADFIFKVTGRYKILNFSTFLKAFYQEPFIDLMIDFKLNLTFSDSRFFGFKKQFILDYLSFYEDIVDDNSGIYFENILCRASLKAVADGYIFRPMNTLPRLVGYSGSLGIKYNSNYWHWLRHMYKYYLKYKGIGLGHLPEL